MHKTYSKNKKTMSCTAELASASESDTECKNHKELFNLTRRSVRNAAVREKWNTGASDIQSGSIRRSF